MHGVARFLGDETKPLPLATLEVERRTAVSNRDYRVRDADLIEPLLPPCQACFTGDAKPRMHDAAPASPLARHRPVEKRDVRAWRCGTVGVKQMLGRNVVLVDRLFHEAQAKHARIEGVVARHVGGDSGEVLESGELHAPTLHRMRYSSSDRTKELAGPVGRVRVS